MARFKDPYHGFQIKRIGSGLPIYYELTPQRQSIRLPKWYTASRTSSGDWYVTNHMGRTLLHGSPLQVRIACACEFQYSGREQSVAAHREVHQQ